MGVTSSGTEGSNPSLSTGESVSHTDEADAGREPLVSRVWAAGLAARSAETRRARQHHANCRLYLCRALFRKTAGDPSSIPGLGKHPRCADSAYGNRAWLSRIPNVATQMIFGGSPGLNVSASG